MTRINDILLCVFVAVLTVLSASAGAVAVGDAVTVTSEHQVVEFGSNERSTTHNGTVEIPLEFTNATTATLVIGDEESTNYEAVVDVTDGDGDGTVTVEFNTNTSQSTPPAHSVSTVDTDDTATVRNESGTHEPGDPPLDAGTYDLTVGAGTFDISSGNFDSLSTFTITSRETNDTSSDEQQSNDEQSVSAPVTYDVSEELVVMNASNQTFRGTSDLSPGTNIQVEVWVPLDPYGYFFSENPTVSENGTWNTTFDFSGRTQLRKALKDDNVTFDVKIRDNPNATWNGSFVNANDVAVSFDDQQSSANSVVVDSVTLPVGGYVVVQSSNGTVLGHSSHISPGTSENVSVSLSKPVDDTQSLSAVAHVDSDDDEQYNANVDQPYLRNGTPVTDDAEVRYEASGQSIPGFTLPATLVALLVVIGIVARRE